MKRILSLWLCTALMLSVIGPVLPAAQANTLPAPYAWFETDGGTLTESEGVTVEALGAQGRRDVLPLEDAEGYGIRLDADWSGISMGGNLFANVPAGEVAVLAVEYYIDVAATANDLQVFRYQLGGRYGDGSHTDLFSLQNGLSLRRSGLLLIPLSAAHIAAARAQADYTIQLMACPHGEKTAYIRSVRLVAPQYTAIATDDRDFIEFEERDLCTYYPDISGVPSRNMTHRDLEQAESLPDVPWLYRYIQVHGSSYTADKTVRRAVYIQLYATAGHENDTVEIIGIEREPDEWGDGETVQMTDGVGGVFLPSTCFGNRLNGVGSFRFLWTEAAKVARVEVFDVETYCAGGTGETAMVTRFHQERIQHGFGTAVTGYRAPTVTEEGYSGDVTCAACGTVLQAGEAIPKKALPAPYAWLTAAEGELQTSEGTYAAPLGDKGNTAVLPIADTGEYGIRLEADWSGFSFGGDVLANVPAGKDIVLSIGYYLDSDVRGQIFRYQIGQAPFADVCSVSHALENRRASVLLIPLTADEAAAWRASGGQLNVLGCPNGAAVTYIRSVRVVATEYTAIPDVGCAYAETGEQTLYEYEPHLLGRPSRGMVCREYETSEDHPDRSWLFRYYAVQSEWQASEEKRDRPLYIKLYAAEGHENDAVSISAIEREAGAWGVGEVVQMTDGTGGVYVPSTNFTNGLNNVGSFRFWWTEAEKVARVELYDPATYCLSSAAEEERIAWLHDRMRTGRFGITLEGYRVPTADEEGYSGDMYCAACGALLENGRGLPPLPADLPTPYGRIDTATGVTWVSDSLTLSPSGALGDTRTVPIADTGKYGIRLAADWSGVALTGEAFRAVPQGEYAVLAIEYYIDSDTAGQMFRYKVGARPQVDFYSSLSNLVHRATSVVLCALTPEEVAQLAAGEPLMILGCPGGVGVTYIQSVQLVAPQYAAGADVGRDSVALSDVPLCDYYPTMLGRYNHGMRYADVREGYDATGALRRYMYFEVTRAVAAEQAVRTPVKIRFVFKEDSTIQEISLDYQCARAQSSADDSIWASRTVTVTDGVAEVALEDACFTNGLYGIGSFRIPNTEVTPAADQLQSVEVFALELPAVMTGDVDGNNRVDSTDARLTLQYAVQKIGADGLDTAVADVDGNGRVDSTDARLILQYAVKKIEAFPAG